MNPPPPSDSIDENLRKEFERRWLRGRPGDIEHFLPPKEDPHYLGTLEELVHIEIELAWKQRIHNLEHDVESDGGTVDQPPPIESYLGRFPDLDDPEILTRLLKQECLVRKQVGVPLSKEMCQARFPDIDLQAADILPYLEVHISADSNTPGATLALDDPGNETIVLPLHFGDYELLEEIGRGSMGIVYRAKQVSRPRIVAVKILRSKLLESSSVGATHRFQQEIRTVSKLRHDNIVCVFDVNENKGHHFFSMQYVRGKSLAEMTSQRPIDNRTAAHYLQQVALAIQYAHRCGVLHRDLKPANILIDDDTNRPLVVDFGLAKISEHGHSITAIGETIGTPSFMSPEQVQNASHATEQSDIYSLGATLYTLLSGKPPFFAARSSETLRQLVEEYPTPLRQLNINVDLDLEAICMKCLQKKPTSRYATAEELANDLDCYLKGGKIQASPVGQYSETFRYLQRNKASFIPLCTIVCLFIIGSLALFYHFLISSKPDRYSTNRMERAEEVVSGVVGNLVDGYTTNMLPKSAVERNLLGHFLDYYAAVLVDSEDNSPNPKFEAKVLLQMARIQASLGNFEEASQLLRTAIRHFQGVVATTGQHNVSVKKTSDPHVADILAHAWFSLGMVEEQLGNVDHAMQDFRQAAEYLKTLVAKSSNNIEYPLLMAHCNTKLASLALARRRWAVSKEYFESANDIYQNILEAEPHNASALAGLAGCYFHRSELERFRGNQRGYREYLESSVQHLQHVVDNPQYTPSLKTILPLVISCRDLGNMYTQMQKPKAAMSWYGKAFEFSQQLSHTNPTSRYQALQADVLIHWAESLNMAGRNKEALKKYEVALKIWQMINERLPTNPEFMCEQAVATGRLAQTQTDLGLAIQARQNLVRAKKMLSKLVREHPGQSHFSAALETILRLQQQLDNQEQTRL